MRACILMLCAGCLNAAHKDDGGAPIDSSATTNDSAILGDSASTVTDASMLPDLTPQSGTWVAVGYGGRRVRSTDEGVTWTDDQSLESNGGDDNDLLRTIVWGDNQFVALGWRVMTSPDGATWTDLGTTPLGNWIGAAAYDQSEFVAIGGYGLRDTSTDAKTWTSHSVDTTAAHPGDGLVYGNGLFAMATDDGKLSWSSDGKAWTYASGTSTSTKTELAYGNDLFVGLAQGGTVVIVSNDGKTWSAGATLANGASGLAFAQGHFTALANGHAYTSNDGKTWTDHADKSVPSGNLVFANGVYLVLGSNDILRSTDGLTWSTAMSTGSTNSLQWAAYGTP